MYWHEIKKVEQERILNSHMTIGEFMRKYKQPPWCNYTDALEGNFGCRSLLNPGKVRDKKFCKKCDCFKGKDMTLPHRHIRRTCRFLASIPTRIHNWFRAWRDTKRERRRKIKDLDEFLDSFNSEDYR